ncbi:MAG: peptidylprolyl isomerase [Bacteroidota bacterium]|nr:peptidylprolyl isomerase [Bacteroidota bacterium]
MKYVSKNKFLVLFSTLLLTTLVLGSFVKKSDEIEVIMTTSKGELILKLYNQTPIHRDNFVKLINNQFYNGISFHRVIKNFMAQAGDPNSRDPEYAGNLGNNSEGETLPAEIFPSLFHKKGALAAARMGDQVNPEKRSSGSQFYIVQGKKYNRNQLTQMEARINQQLEGNRVGIFLKDSSNKAYMNRVKVCQQNGWMDSLNMVISEIKNIVLKDVDKFTFSEEQLKAYETIGGTPFLDNGYTVFGEVVSGIDIIDSICTSPTLPGDKPQEPIIILSVKINS